MCIPTLMNSTPRMIGRMSTGLRYASLNCVQGNISATTTLKPVVPQPPPSSTFSTFGNWVTVTTERDHVYGKVALMEMGRGAGSCPALTYLGCKRNAPIQVDRRGGTCPVVTYLGIVLAFSTIIMLNLIQHDSPNRKETLS